ncbi:MAG: mechanosensitive ion channel family protein [Anaerolineae bacterium]|nr:mechanosensitive ion channel family protein [Anaerolineae bacterium]
MNLDFSPAIVQLQSMVSGLIGVIPNLLVALVVFILFYFISKGIKNLVQSLSARYRRHKNLGLVLGRLSQSVVILLGLLIASVIVFPNFTPAQLIQLLGIGSVAVGFAFRDILQNFLAGILLLLTEPFRIGDQIIVSGFEGTVEDIQARATTLKTYDGRRVVIPNADLFTDSVIVNTALEQRRLEYDVGIGYGDDIAQAKELILAAVRTIEGVLPEPSPDVLVVELAASSVIIRVRWWIRPPRRADALDSKDAVLMAIKNKLTENGIDLPFPTQQILFHDQTEETDGDRARQREGWPAGPGRAPEAYRIADALKKLADMGMERNGTDQK